MAPGSSKPRLSDTDISQAQLDQRKENFLGSASKPAAKKDPSESLVALQGTGKAKTVSDWLAGRDVAGTPKKGIAPPSLDPASSRPAPGSLSKLMPFFEKGAFRTPGRKEKQESSETPIPSEKKISPIKEMLEASAKNCLGCLTPIKSN